ncbi:hypothetical protein QTP86_019468 [Hemibagrus guttatus]|nr:hypothetical protein QTP86_019468 [Hemibagrus guttatus]
METRKMAWKQCESEKFVLLKGRRLIVRFKMIFTIGGLTNQTGLDGFNRPWSESLSTLGAAVDTLHILLIQKPLIHTLQKLWPQGVVTGSFKISRHTEQLN